MASPSVRDDEPSSRYLAERDGGTLGFAAYRRADGVTTFTHTVVDPQHEGEGVGTTLIRAALDAERAAGRTIVPRCPFVAAFVQHHPDYADLVASA